MLISGRVQGTMIIRSIRPRLLILVRATTDLCKKESSPRKTCSFLPSFLCDLLLSCGLPSTSPICSVRLLCAFVPPSGARASSLLHTRTRISRSYNPQDAYPVFPSPPSILPPPPSVLSTLLIIVLLLILVILLVFLL